MYQERYLNKREVTKMFKERVLPTLKSIDDTPDYPARREAWNDFTDQLCKGGMISYRKYETWGHPDCCAPKRKSRAKVWINGRQLHEVPFKAFVLLLRQQGEFINVLHDVDNVAEAIKYVSELQEDFSLYKYEGVTYSGSEIKFKKTSGTTSHRQLYGSNKYFMHNEILYHVNTYEGRSTTYINRPS